MQNSKVVELNPNSNELTLIVAEDSHPFIPEGRYEVSYAFHHLRWYFGQKKLYVHFVICTPGEHYGVKLFKVYNFYQKLPRGSALKKDLELLSGVRALKNASLKLCLFDGKVLEVSVRTVRQNHKQRELAGYQQYSVIDEIVRIIAGDMRP